MMTRLVSQFSTVMCTLNPKEFVLSLLETGSHFIALELLMQTWLHTHRDLL